MVEVVILANHCNFPLRSEIGKFTRTCLSSTRKDILSHGCSQRISKANHAPNNNPNREEKKPLLQYTNGGWYNNIPPLPN